MNKWFLQDTQISPMTVKIMVYGPDIVRTYTADRYHLTILANNQWLLGRRGEKRWLRNR